MLEYHPLVSQKSQAAPFLSLPLSLPVSLLCQAAGTFLHILTKLDIHMGETEAMLFRKAVGSWQAADGREATGLA